MTSGRNMVRKRILVVFVVIVLLIVALGAGYILLTSGPPPGAAPTVTSTSPDDAVTGVPVDTKVLATFSKAMDPSTITTSTFLLKQGTTAVSGLVSYAGLTATFDPASDLAASTAHTATITTGAKDASGRALAVDFVWSFTTGQVADTTAPTVTFTSPAVGATGVPINTKVLATFSEAMDPSTITASTFTLKRGTTSVAGTVSYTGVTATFAPSSNLAASAAHTATITTGAKDLAGNALAANFVWGFTTGALPDTIPPLVTFTSPLDTATGVAVNANILATFSEAMDPLTVTTSTFTLKQGTTPVSGTVTLAGLTATFNPASNLAASTAYTATITTGVKDLAGNALAANFVWGFTTGTLPDTTPPLVTSTFPVDTATGVAVNANILATFSEAMDPLTVTTSTFTLKQGTTPVSGLVSYAGLTATFNPASNLTATTVYTATITTGVKDLAGNALAANFVWGFTTGSTGSLGPAPVVLGTAGNFVILGKTSISTTGTTAIVGDLGLSPAATSFITGFALSMDPSNVFATSSLVTGRIYAADMAPPTPTTMTTAILDMQNAFTDAAGRTLPDFTELGAGNLDGLTLVPGLYKWGTGVTFATGVTISGGANDVWIFQIAQDLTVGNGAIVTLSGGAQAKNIFWQVSGQVILGTTSDFKGIILCQTQIALQTGAVLLGRALAQTAVTLDANAVTRP